MKQNLSEAKQALVVSFVLMCALISCAGCVKRVSRHSSGSNSRIESSRADGTRININTAAADELEQLPGIGRVIAERIIEHRSEHGPFRRVEHVMMVRGISEQKFSALEPLITIHERP